MVLRPELGHGIVPMPEQMQPTARVGAPTHITTATLSSPWYVSALVRYENISAYHDTISP
jgi:hypothetical protein